MLYTQMPKTLKNTVHGYNGHFFRCYAWSQRCFGKHFRIADAALKYVGYLATEAAATVPNADLKKEKRKEKAHIKCSPCQNTV